jgi:ribose transport system substrate-binding protein
MRVHHPRASIGLTAATVAALVLAACSSGLDDDSGDAGGGSASDGASGDTSVFGAGPEGEANDSIDLEAAQELVDEYMQPADSIVVDEPLAEPIDTDLTVAYMDNDTPVGALMWDEFEEAAAAAGLSADRVSVGVSAESVNTAFSSVVQNPPDIVVAPTIDPTFYTDQLEQLQEGGTTVVTGSITNAEDFGLQDGYGGYGTSVENGYLLAASAITVTCGQATDFVFYNVPEFGFSNISAEAAGEAFEEFCAGECNLRVVDIPVAQMSTGGADAVLSDLQAHPETAAFITGVDEIQVGLPAKQDLAGIDVPGIGMSSTPPNVEQIANGDQAGGFIVDFSAFMWLLLDQGLRLEQGMDYPEPDWPTINPQVSMVLTHDNADLGVGGYVAVEDYQDQFAALWGVE